MNRRNKFLTILGSLIVILIFATMLYGILYQSPMEKNNNGKFIDSNKWFKHMGSQDLR